MWGFLKNIWNRLWGNTQETGMPQNEQIPQGLGIAQEQQSPQGLGIVQESQSPQGLGIVQDQQTDRVDGDNKEDSTTLEKMLIEREIQTEQPTVRDVEVQMGQPPMSEAGVQTESPWNLDVEVQRGEAIVDEPIAKPVRAPGGPGQIGSTFRRYVNPFDVLKEIEETEETKKTEEVGVNTEIVNTEERKEKGVITDDIAIKEQIRNSSQAGLWGTLSNGVNQGVRHFCDYWVTQPDRIPMIENALGLSSDTFRYSPDGFNAFTNAAQNVIAQARENGICKRSGGKEFFYLPREGDPDSGVIVIRVGRKLQSMMPGTRESFDRMT